MAQDGFNELLDWLRGVDKTSMITNNASMRVVEETFTISSPYEYLDIAYKFKKVEQWFSFWTLMPIGRLSYIL